MTTTAQYLSGISIRARTNVSDTHAAVPKKTLMIGESALPVLVCLWSKRNKGFEEPDYPYLMNLRTRHG
jgi:hypothetical protein